MQLNINSDAAVALTNKLEKLSRSALPVAVRSTLNSAAFDVKKTTMPQQAAATFTIRKPNFFKANSRVEMAKGFNLKSMKASVGFTSTSLNGGNNFAVKDLEEQESGGTISGKSFIPLKQARGGNQAKAVRPKNRLTGIRNVVNAKNMPGTTPGQKFIQAIEKAGVGGYIINSNRFKKTLFRVKAVGVNRKVEQLYSYQANRSISVKGRHFMKIASMESANKMERIFQVEGKKQIQRVLK